jgi:hypothetical protein
MGKLRCEGKDNRRTIRTQVEAARLLEFLKQSAQKKFAR